MIAVEIFWFWKYRSRRNRNPIPGSLGKIIALKNMIQSIIREQSPIYNDISTGFRKCAHNLYRTWKRIGMSLSNYLQDSDGCDTFWGWVHITLFLWGPDIYTENTSIPTTSSIWKANHKRVMNAAVDMYLFGGFCSSLDNYFWEAGLKFLYYYISDFHTTTSTFDGLTKNKTTRKGHLSILQCEQLTQRAREIASKIGSIWMMIPPSSCSVARL